MGGAADKPQNWVKVILFFPSHGERQTAGINTNGIWLRHFAAAGTPRLASAVLLAVFLPGVTAVNSGGQEIQKPAGAEMQSWKTCQVFFEESGPADDNPWGVTAGIIDSGGGGECILLTPGTAVDLMDMDLLKGYVL